MSSIDVNLGVVGMDDVTRIIGQVGAGAKFSHKVFKAHLAQSEKTWFCKEMDDPAAARVEILSEEFFRLMIPHQPETRMAIRQPPGTYFILSEEVPGYHNLPKREAENFENGIYSGLGQVVVGSMFLQEIDLKNGNLGLDNKGRVIKIDGDWCFAEHRYDDELIGQYEITPTAIEMLPYPGGFYAFNWLDLIQEDVAHPVSSIVRPELSSASQFRKEVNQAMLQICLLPDCFIEQFVDAYIPAGAEQFIQIIENRRDELKKSALHNESFTTYLKTEAAKADAEAIYSQMNSFVAHGSHKIVSDEMKMQLENYFMRMMLPFGDLAIAHVVSPSESESTTDLTLSPNTPTSNSHSPALSDLSNASVSIKTSLGHLKVAKADATPSIDFQERHGNKPG